MERNPCVYILASKKNGTLYVGVTSNLAQRINQHRFTETASFTSTHSVKKLVYIEFHSDMEAAINREKKLKKWRRSWKLALIERENPNWVDLAELFY